MSSGTISIKFTIENAEIIYAGLKILPSFMNLIFLTLKYLMKVIYMISYFYSCQIEKQNYITDIPSTCLTF